MNISIDSPDLNSDYVSENLALNDQESVIEIILEQVMGFEDAVMELDDSDSEDHSRKNNFKIDYIIQFTADSLIASSELIFKLQYFHADAHLTAGYYGFDSPPPKI